MAWIVSMASDLLSKTLSEIGQNDNSTKALFRVDYGFALTTCVPDLLMKSFTRYCCVGLLVLGLVFGLSYVVGGKQMEFSAEIEIDASAAEVFAHLTEEESLKQWIDGLVDIRPLGNEGHQIGAKAELIVEESGRQFTMQDELLGFEQDKSISLRISSDMFESVNSFRIDPSGDGVAVRQLMQINHRGVFRSIAPLIKNQVQQKIEADLVRLKQLCESKTSSN